MAYRDPRRRRSAFRASLPVMPHPGFVLFAVVLLASALPLSALAAPYHPKADAEVLTRLTAPLEAGGDSLRERRAALRLEPRNLDLALSVARRYVSLGRAEGDPRFYGYAEAALEPWLHLSGPPLDVLVLRAVLRQAGHDFDGALSDLDRVLDMAPGHAQASLTRAVILTVQGRYAAAARACRSLGRRSLLLVRAACTAAAQGRNGAAEESYRRLSQAFATSRETDPALVAWVHGLLGEMAERLGRQAAAEAHYRNALSAGERSAYLLGALADLLLDQGRFAEVRELLAEEARDDALLLRLALAESRPDSSRSEDYRARLESRFEASRRRGDSRHLREEARFTLQLLDRPEAALGLALENWRSQREPWDVRLVLEAALASGDVAAAKPVLAWLEEKVLESVRIDALVAKLEGERES